VVWREPAPLGPAELSLAEHPLLAALLHARGVTSRAEADLFLRPRGGALGDPLTLPDLQRAVELIHAAVAAGERIAVFGDYDVDGLTSTALLVRVLRKLGAEPLYSVPHRAHDGYGLNRAAVERFIEAGARLLITVDCGSSNQAELEYALEYGLRAIVLDHHQIDAELPAEVAFVSALRPSNAYPTTSLTGVGVAYTLTRALLGDAEAEMYLPYVALGTIADVAALRGENRTLVARGLAKLRRWQLPGLLALCAVAGIEQAQTRAWDVGFLLAPRLNAAGRMDSPQAALDLLLADSAAVATPLAVRLDELNRRRQDEMRRMIDTAEAQLAAQGGAEEQASIVVADPSWSIGLVGLAAGRLAERYHRPVIALEQGAEVSRGSGRSPAGIDLMAALRETAPLLERFGGHRRAAGLALPTAHIAEFRPALCAAVLRGCDGELPAPELRLDAELRPADLSLDTVALLEALEPLGAGNEAPLLLARNLTPRACRASNDGRHLIFQVADQRGATHDAIFFGAGERLDELRGARRVDLATELRRDVWNGRVKLKLRVTDFRPAG
jgi:single-stranded-DNA-specific exonuclease